MKIFQALCITLVLLFAESAFARVDPYQGTQRVVRVAKEEAKQRPLPLLCFATQQVRQKYPAILEYFYADLERLRARLALLLRLFDWLLPGPSPEEVLRTFGDQCKREAGHVGHTPP